MSIFTIAAFTVVACGIALIVIANVHAWRRDKTLTEVKPKAEDDENRRDIGW